ncbi:DPP IV N-terminal domain-containing protein [candidate division KSB1 bacterium]
MKTRFGLYLLLCLFVLAAGCSTEQPESVQTSEETGGRQIQQRPPQPGVISSINWSDDGKYLTYRNMDENFQFDLETFEITSLGKIEEEETRGAGRAAGRGGRQRGQGQQQQREGGREIQRPSRGHQFMTEQSPDEQWYAVCRDYNVWIENDNTGQKIQVTTGGNMKFRYGTANWTYGEELGVRNGMWWTPDSKKLIYYVFSEEHVQDYYLLGSLTDTYTTILSEGYIKAGYPNPIVTLEVYDLQTKRKRRIDVGEKGRDQYIYSMRFTPDGSELLFNRIDRFHHDLDVLALDYTTGNIRRVISEHQDSWQSNSPRMQFLEDEKRFLWPTEKTMWNHYELRHLDGSLIATLTKGEYPVTSIVKVDEEHNLLYYKAGNGINPISDHLHKVNLDGTGAKQLTSQPFNHTTINISPDNKFFTVQYEDIETPPSTAVYTTDGELVKVLAEGPKLENNRSEMFTFKANDGVTDIFGVLHKPEDFNPNKTYPLIISVYGGPGSRAVRNSYQNGSNTYNRLGYLVAQIDNRGTSGRGKEFMAAGYMKLGDVDIQDQADGARFLAKRSYIDERRIGIVGSSYGGYMAAMGAVKHSDIFAAAVNKSGVTHWKNYDSIYTERYMSTPQENPEGYENGSAMNFVDQMECNMLIMHGMMDDNVHPNNAWQLIDALDQAGKRYESRFFPHAGHGVPGRDTEQEFFYRYLMEPFEK